MFKRRETIIFIVLTVGIIILTLIQLDEIFFIYEIAKLFLYFLVAGTFLYTIYRVAKDKRQLPFIQKSKSLIFGLSLFGFLFLISYLADTDGGKKRVMTGGFTHDLNSIYLQLFDDNKFKLLNLGPFGGKFYRGNYTLKNDTLKIDNDSLRYLYPSLTFLLKQKEDKTKYFESTDTLKAIYQLLIYKDFRKD